MRIILVDDMKNISSLKGYPELMTRYIKVVFWRVGEMCSIVEYWLGLFFLYKYRLQIVYYLILNICFSCKILTLAEKICKKNYPETIQKRSENDPKTIQKRCKNDPKTMQKRTYCNHRFSNVYNKYQDLDQFIKTNNNTFYIVQVKTIVHNVM